jgi:hypothetical protein
MGLRNGNASSPNVTWEIPSDFKGLSSLLDEGQFSDIDVQLAEGKIITAHRVLLAAASDVLKAKFSVASPFNDAAARGWTPDVGSAAAWQWLIGWMYGRDDPLPPEMFVEVLILADQFQIKTLVRSITSLPIGNMAYNLTQQFLEAWACPEVLTNVAAECVPTVVIDHTILACLKTANMQNLALFIKFVPGISEVERLQLLGASLRGTGTMHRTFSDCFLDVVNWDLFPADVLEAALSGDLKYFEELLGQPVSFSERLRSKIVKGLVQRCQNFEQKLPSCVDAHMSAFCPLPAEPRAGLFAWIAEKDMGVEIELSSAHSCVRSKGKHDLLSLNTVEYGTDQQSPMKHPWIELRSRCLSISPHGIGLKHGWGGSDVCRTFVVEAASSGTEAWSTLLEVPNTPLIRSCQVFSIPEERALGKYFDRFRIRMTGPTSSGTWYLMVGWFDVFGTTRSTALSGFFGEAASSTPKRRRKE